MRLVFDTEANGLLDTADTLWCIVVKDVDSKCKPTSYSDKIGLGIGLQALYQASTLIGHNIIGYDLPLLKKLYGWSPRPGTEIIDTLVLSRLFNPDRIGGHSLNAWGKKLGRYKPEHEDWSQFSQEMLHRCTEDVEINHLVYQSLMSEATSWDWGQSIGIEHQVADIIARQERSGVQFDTTKAEELVEHLTRDIEAIDNELLPGLPKKAKQYGVTISAPFKKDGTYKKTTSDWGLGDSVSGPFTRIVWEDFNLGSDKQVKQYLMDLGWEPTEYNHVIDSASGHRRKTSPKLTPESLPDSLGYLGGKIKERLIRRHRRSQIEGWLKSVRSDGRLSAGAIPCGTNTGRMRHTTVVNVPRAGSFYGSEMRSLFIPKPGYVMVGHDAAGLELRMLAHYMDDWDYSYQILNSDIHTYNMQLAGLQNRDQAKTFIYAFIYGAGDYKIGSIVNGTEIQGALLRDRFLTKLPALEELITQTDRESKRGYIVGLDGRKVYTRHGKSPLNTKLQSAGAVVMKQSMILLDNWVAEEKLDVTKVIDMHDEAQAEVHPDCVERYKELAVKSIVEAGNILHLNIDLAADVKDGNNWSETH